mmetsp:Transcript_19007/g.42533  ORF Transcript_19007/g.42533 Transcript_19007/m.42533 type:complete len:115 (+) Transcript_19007:186-530(+)
MFCPPGPASPQHPFEGWLQKGHQEALDFSDGAVLQEGCANTPSGSCPLAMLLVVWTIPASQYELVDGVEACLPTPKSERMDAFGDMPRVPTELGGDDSDASVEELDRSCCFQPR